ncbi:MAG: preprotein translocase subunit YajC [Eubacterium sp.]|nr:preprotein translocase subunit YajC [Eubacterium sp.]
MILASGSASGGGMGSMVILMVALVAIMYFMMIRPQNKERKRVEAMLSAMEVGDSVVTSSGFYGVIIDIAGDDVIVEFGNNRNCRIPMKKEAIAQVEKPGDFTAASSDDKEKK